MDDKPAGDWFTADLLEIDSALALAEWNGGGPDAKSRRDEGSPSRTPEVPLAVARRGERLPVRAVTG